MTKEEYLIEALSGILQEEGFSLSESQVNAIGKRLAEAESVYLEYSGEIEQTRSPRKVEKTKDQKRIEKLERVVKFFENKLGVTVDLHSMRVEGQTPCGTTHWTTSIEYVG